MMTKPELLNPLHLACHSAHPNQITDMSCMALTMMGGRGSVEVLPGHQQM